METTDGSSESSLIFRIRQKLVEYWRVLLVTKKPTMPEFKVIVKVSGLGMAIIGIVGFIIQMLREVFI